MRLHTSILTGATLLLTVLVSATPALASSGIISPQATNIPITTSLSENWSGYVADSGTDYTSVTGTWVIPSVTASTSVAADAAWVGIGGLSGTDLIQAGTQAIVENGSTTYQAWYETLPDASNPVSLVVNPGDSITSSITETSQNTWLIKITDNTTGQNYSTTVNYTSSLSSAEWIQEMPSDQVGFIPLDNFGSITFTNASTVTNGVTQNLTQSGAHALTIVSDGLGSSVLAYPSAIGNDGASFTVTRSDTASTIIPHIVRIGRRGGFTRGPRGIQGFTTGSTTGEIETGYSDQAFSQLIQQMLGSDPFTQTYTSGPLTIHITTYSS